MAATWSLCKNQNFHYFTVIGRSLKLLNSNCFSICVKIFSTLLKNHQVGFKMAAAQTSYNYWTIYTLTKHTFAKTTCILRRGIFSVILDAKCTPTPRTSQRFTFQLLWANLRLSRNFAQTNGGVGEKAGLHSFLVNLLCAKVYSSRRAARAQSRKVSSTCIISRKVKLQIRNDARHHSSAPV